MAATLDNDMAARLSAHLSLLEKRETTSDTTETRAPRFFKPLFPLLAAALFGVGAAVGFLYPRFRPEPPVLKINGADISRQEFQHRCELAAGPAVLEQLTKEELQLGMARKESLMPTEEQVTEKLEQLRQNPDWVKQQESQHKSEADIRRGVLLDLAQNALLTQSVRVSEAEVNDYYRRNTDPHNPKALYYRPEAVQVAAIISDNQTDITSALHELAAGKPFAEVVVRYSKDNSKQNSGLLPAICKGQMDNRKFPGLEKAFFSLQPGQQVDTLNVAGAWWIVRCVGRQHEETLPFEKVKAECLEGATLEKGMQQNGQSVQEASKQFQQEAHIEILDSKYKSAASK
jgi:hypothetical protein